jgi:hypothetical protein
MEEFEEFKEFQEFKEDRNGTFNYLFKDGRTRNAENEIRFERSGRADRRLLELLELLRLVILARRLLSGCRQFWSIAWVPWVRFKMGVFQSPDLRIAEAKDVIDL